VYLDDLKLLQENDERSVSDLLYALGLDSFSIDPVNTHKNTDDSYTVDAGSAWLNHELVDWPATTISASDWTGELWLCIKASDTDVRTHEDGQERSCVTSTMGYVSADKTGATACIDLLTLKTLPVALSAVVKGEIDHMEDVWKSVNVKWLNGYSGKVQYQDRADCYRVRINAKSSNYTELTGSVELFSVDESAYRWLCVFASDRRAFVGSENGVSGFYISAFEGCVRADASLPFDDVTNAASLPINAIFEIPK